MKTNPKKIRPSGFALIVTLTLMILLTVIAVGLLTLSSVSLRVSGQTSAASVARSNARLGMMIALGELQKSLGPDKAVSAPASAISDTPAQPHLTGAWNQKNASDYWHWDPSNGAPNYSSKQNNFRGWLVSTTRQDDALELNYANGAAPTDDSSIALVGNPSKELKDSQQQSTTVMAGKVKVGETSKSGGAYSWAVFDESTKASIDFGDDPATQIDQYEEIATRSVASRYRADAISSNLSSLKEPKQLVSLGTAELGVGVQNRDEIKTRFHDFTTSNTGLLTNSAVGGLKTDLTSLFEPGDNNLPPGTVVDSTNNLVYPNTGAFTAPNGNLRWSYLRDHYRKFKTMSSLKTAEPIYSLAGNKPDIRINNTTIGGVTINKGDPAGYSPSPDTERLLPVIAKLQIVFSIVAHRPNLADRVTQWNAILGPNNFAVPHLVYDVVVTLYNPYDVTLNLAKTRIRVWDPPVGFRFTNLGISSGAFFRDPAVNDGFTGLAQMQIDNQYNMNARRCFTLVLADGTRDTAGGSLKLKPGEVKVFSPRVDTGWNWGMETGSGGRKVFFDYDQNSQFGNKDGRTGNPYGVETVPGWWSMAGLQADHLATNNRYPPSKYPNNPGDGDGFVTMALGHQLKVDIKPLVTSADATKQFQVDILAGSKPGSLTANAGAVLEDTLRTYSFNFVGKDPSQDISENPTSPIISKTYRINDMLQDFGDQSSAKKKVIAMLEMSGRPTRESTTDNKPWLYNNMVVEGGEQDTARVGLSNQPYDLRLREMTSLDSPDKGIAVEPKTYRGYYGAGSRLVDGGSTFVPMLHVPLAPAASLGDLVHANLASGATLPRVMHPFGNARAHPLIPANKVSYLNGSTLLDHSYLLNDSLWDGYYFSTMTEYASNGLVEPRNIEQVLTGVFGNTKPAINNRLIPVSSQDASERATELANLNDADRSRQLAKYLAVKGPFNVNSTSLDAWRAVLMSLRDREVSGVRAITGSTANFQPLKYDNNEKTPFIRMNKPLASSDPGTGQLWAGYRALSDNQIEQLAGKIVEEIKERGKADGAPPFSVGEFVNRRPGSSVHENAGLLQTALDESDINRSNLDRDSINVTSTSKRMLGVQNNSVMSGKTAEGAPSALTQGDLMAALAPIITVRGDTFKIRSYGEATSGGTVTARAWCETVVQRMPDYVDASEVAETQPAQLQSDSNIVFGRRFNIVSFRWLSESEL